MAPPRPRISVVIATRDGVPFVSEQIETILSQSMVPDEIVLSDDASQDGTVEGVSAAVEAFRRGGRTIDLVVIRNPRPLGVRGNFEAALRSATGDLIVLSDQDDRWHPDRIATAVALFASRPELQLVHADATLIDADGTELGRSLFDVLPVRESERAAIHGGDALTVLLRRNVVTGATTMVRRDLVREALPIPEGWIHDEWLAIWAAATSEIDVIDAPLIDYRQHGRNAVGVSRRTFSLIASRFREPGIERNMRLLVRSQSLLERARSRHLAESVLSRFEAKLEHERARSALPRVRVARLGPILRELSTGRYAQYGNGGADALRDLLQPRGTAKIAG